jgi:uncharacterized membrane protein SpoIIM required for sporulation/uncharacterized RDD family membrane protein YckC
MKAQTSEGIEFELYPAGLPIRACAYAIDTFLQWALIVILWLTVELLGKGFGMWLLLILIFALDWLYHVVWEILDRGQSLGKRIMGIRVVRSDGSPVNPGASLLRNLLRFADTFMFLYIIVFLAITASKGFRRLGDWAADTMVVYTAHVLAPAVMKRRPRLAYEVVVSEQSFRRRREPYWREAEAVIYGGQRELKGKAGAFPRLYRELTQDLNTAKSRGFNPLIIERLNGLVLEGKQLLYGQHEWSYRLALNFVCRDFPCAVRHEWRGVLAALFIFYGIAVFFGVLCVRFPDLVYEIIPTSQVESIEDMYNPASEYYLTPRNVDSDADMFGYYIYNNVSIAFRTFAGGILAGFGSLLILCLNAVFMGVTAGHIINKGFFGETFFPFIVAHGSFELTAIVLSAHAGLLLGYRLLIPRGLTRAASLRLAGKTAIPLISGVAVFLIIAAALEAFWSSRHELPLSLRVGVGIALWILVLAYFLFAGRKRGSYDTK